MEAIQRNTNYTIVPSPFLELLPPELRLCVYEYTLSYTGPEEVDLLAIEQCGPDTDLLSTCRFIYNESKPTYDASWAMFWSTTDFHACITSDFIENQYLNNLPKLLDSLPFTSLWTLQLRFVGLTATKDPASLPTINVSFDDDVLQASLSNTGSCNAITRLGLNNIAYHFRGFNGHEEVLKHIRSTDLQGRVNVKGVLCGLVSIFSCEFELRDIWKFAS